MGSGVRPGPELRSRRSPEPSTNPRGEAMRPTRSNTSSTTGATRPPKAKLSPNDPHEVVDFQRHVSDDPSRPYPGSRAALLADQRAIENSAPRWSTSRAPRRCTSPAAATGKPPRATCRGGSGGRSEPRACKTPHARAFSPLAFFRSAHRRFRRSRRAHLAVSSCGYPGTDAAASKRMFGSDARLLQMQERRLRGVREPRAE